MPHPNSLMYNVYVVPFWPMKVYWTVKKVRVLVCNNECRLQRLCFFVISPNLLRAILTRE